MDLESAAPAWEDTQPVDVSAVRAPASTPAPAAPPAWEDTSEVPAQATSSEAPAWEDTTDLQGQYGTPGQEAIAGAEAIGRGALGPIFTGAERLAGVPGENIRLREEASPWIAGGLEAGSFAGTAFLTGGTSAELATLPGLVGKVGEVGKLAPYGLKTAARLGTELMAMQGGSELSKAIEQDPNQTVGSALENIGLSGVLGSAIGLPLGTLSTAWNKLALPAAEKMLGKIKADFGMGEALPKEEQIVIPELKSFLNRFGGVPKEIMEDYSAQRDLVNAAPDMSEVYGHSLDHILDMKDNLETKKATVAEAKAAFSDFLDEQKTALKQKGYDANAANRLAQEALQNAQDRIAIGLQNGAIEAGPQAYGAVEKLRQNVFDLSAGARDILDNTPGQLSLKPFNSAIRGMQDELYAQGFPSLADGLQKEADFWGSQYGDKLDYPNAKSMIQGLSKKGKWSMNATAFDNGLAPYYNRLRFVMDDALKDAVPEYRAAMEPTADATGLLKKLNRYGTPETATSAIKGLTNPFKYATDMPLLRDLESKTSINFADPIEQYANPEVREKMIQAHPDYKNSLRTAEALQQLKDPETQRALQNAPYLSQIAQRAKLAQTALEGQESRMAQFKGITENTLEGKLKSVKLGKNNAAAAALSHIPGMESMNDMTVPEILHLIHVREAFEKGAMNGSRNVNLLAKIGGGLGSVVGGIAGGVGGLAVGHPIVGAGIGTTFGGPIGTAAGAYAGGVLDKEGPALVKQYLDRYLDKYGDLPKTFGTTSENVKAVLLHFLGKDIPPSGQSFKSGVNYIDAAKKGSNILKRGTQSIFDSSKMLPNHIWTNQDKINKLDEKAKEIKENETGLLNTGGNVGHYMPAHGAAMAQNVARAMNYINENRPFSQKNAPLDEVQEPTPEQDYSFKRGLELAEQPMSIIKRIKDDTILPEDVAHLNAMYPEYLQHMRSQVTQAMTDHLAKGGSIPYTTRQNLSLFLGETLDSSMAPQNIMAAQSVYQMQSLQSQQMAQNKPAPASKTKGLEKAPSQYMTANQSAEARQSRIT